MFLYITWLLFGCQYQRNRLSDKTHHQNDLLCVEWDASARHNAPTSVFGFGCIGSEGAPAVGSRTKPWYQSGDQVSGDQVPSKRGSGELRQSPLKLLHKCHHILYCRTVFRDAVLL